MNRSTRTLGIALLVAAIGTGWTAAHVPGPATLVDEYVPLVEAMRIRSGEVPYRDFATHYAPLVPYLDAALSLVTAHEILPPRLLTLTFVGATLLVLTLGAIGQTGSARRGAGVGLLAGLSYGMPYWNAAFIPASAFVVAAFAAVQRARDVPPDRRARWLAIAGGLLGAASVARHDIAFVATVPLSGWVAATEWRRGGAGASRALTTLLGVAFVPSALGALALARAQALTAALDELIRLPLTVYRSGAHLGMPSPRDLAGYSVYVPLALGGLALGRAGLDELARRRGRLPDDPGAAAAAGAFTLACFEPAIVRPDLPHVVPAKVAAFLALAALARRPSGLARKVLLAAGLGVVAPMAMGEGASAVFMARAILSPDSRFVASGPRRGLLAQCDLPADRREVMSLLESRPPGSRVFVGLIRHDRIWINDVGLYFDLDALPATRDYMLLPWLRNDAAQSVVVADLERTCPPFAVLVSVQAPDEPNESRVTAPVHVLDDYLARRYELVRTIGPYCVLRRRGP